MPTWVAIALLLLAGIAYGTNDTSGCSFNDLQVPEGASVNSTGGGTCEANQTVPFGGMCDFNRSGYTCQPSHCNNITGWTPSKPLCVHVHEDDDDDEKPYGGIAVVLVIAPTLVVLIVWAILRIREARMAAASQ
eukprot:Sspe_Gene.115289::Locus_102295_Transcript_1_2_Confidence_0.500_Length_574::g.115289::m.115289